MINTTTFDTIWTETIVPVYDVPKTLFKHQLDAMSLLFNGENVFLGKFFLNQMIKIFHQQNNFIGVPTGAGKTLPQLGTILAMDDQAIVIPPLVTNQMQMANICEAWKIPYINLADNQNLERLSGEQKPKIILASIEDVADAATQRKLINLDVAYVAVDECQVSLHMDAFK